MKRTVLLALLALLPLLAPAAGTATVRVTNSGRVPITVAGRTIRPSATASIPVPAGEAGAFAASVPDGFGLAVPPSYPSLRPGGIYLLRLSAERRSVPFALVSLPSAPPVPMPIPPGPSHVPMSIPSGSSLAPMSKMCFVPEDPLVPNPGRANKGAMEWIRTLADATLDGVDAMIDGYEIKDDAGGSSGSADRRRARASCIGADGDAGAV